MALPIAGAGAAAATGPVGMGFLLAMQASGMVIDYLNTSRQKKLIQMGRQIEDAAFQSSLEAIRLESSEASLQELKQLRQNIGTQIAVQAARGTSSGQGNSVISRNNSINTYNEDERRRRMNLLSKESQLRANNVLSGMHTLQSETQLGQAFAGRVIDQLGVSSAFDQFKQSDLAKKWGFGYKSAS